MMGAIFLSQCDNRVPRSRGAPTRRMVVALAASAFVLLLCAPVCEGFGMSRAALPLRRGAHSAFASPFPSVGRRIGRASMGGLVMQVWSNEQAVQEYKDYLEGARASLCVRGICNRTSFAVPLISNSFAPVLSSISAFAQTRWGRLRARQPRVICQCAPSHVRLH